MNKTFTEFNDCTKRQLVIGNDYLVIDGGKTKAARAVYGLDRYYNNAGVIFEGGFLNLFKLKNVTHFKDSEPHDDDGVPVAAIITIFLLGLLLASACFLLGAIIQFETEFLKQWL